MRWSLLLCLLACTTHPPAESGTTVAREADAPPLEPNVVAPEPIVVPGRGAAELIEEAGVRTFVEDRDFEVAAIDPAAMERWFQRPPRGVFLYTEASIEVAEPGETVRGQCQRAARWDSNVVNELVVVLWKQGTLRTVLELGQARVGVVDQEREGGGWDTRSLRTLPMGAVVWDDEHVVYAEGAAVYEVACVPALRTVSCGGEALLGPRGHCLDRELVVRPWRAPTVPHVGPVIPAYDDPIPRVPEGDCELSCEPSACAEAVRTLRFPRVPLYGAEAPMLAAFRTEDGCRVFAAEREPRAAAEERVW
jgi:hypothetical protein